jgi:NAD(P)-dependent dehydrogenase (short-subunit alcohol dehydrogenase family)
MQFSSACKVVTPIASAKLNFQLFQKYLLGAFGSWNEVSNMKMDSQVALVTGGASGIGAATVSRMVREGAKVASLDKVPHETEGVFTTTVDLNTIEELEGAADRVRAAVGDPDVVIHCAATSIFADTIETSDADIERIFRVNVGSAFRLANIFAPAMQKKGRGAFVLLASITGIVGAQGQSAYAASKGALITLTKTMALELAESGVRVNCVCPASVDTPLFRASFASSPDPEAARERNRKRHPLGRFGTPDDIANLVLFLASDEASWITGGTYVIDGGASIARR